MLRRPSWYEEPNRGERHGGRAAYGINEVRGTQRQRVRQGLLLSRSCYDASLQTCRIRE